MLVYVLEVNSFFQDRYTLEKLERDAYMCVVTSLIVSENVNVHDQ